MTLGWAALYVLFAFLVMRWNRGVLPVAAALAVLMIIFAAVAAGGWFARDKPGLESPALPEDLLGLLTVIVIPVQLLLLIVAMIGFNQAWNVEEERPIGDRSAPPAPPGGGETVTGPRPEEPATDLPPEERTNPGARSKRTATTGTAPGRTPPSERPQNSFIGGSSRCGPSSRTSLTASPTSRGISASSGAGSQQLEQVVDLRAGIDPGALRIPARARPASGRAPA